MNVNVPRHERRKDKNLKQIYHKRDYHCLVLQIFSEYKITLKNSTSLHSVVWLVPNPTQPSGDKILFRPTKQSGLKTLCSSLFDLKTLQHIKIREISAFIVAHESVMSPKYAVQGFRTDS